MRSCITWLVLLAMLSIVIQPVLAAEFSIYVFDSDSKMPVKNAFIRVWEENNLVDNGNADNNGLFITYLDDGRTYHIKAQYFDKWDEKLDYLAESAKSNKINLSLHA